MARTPATIEVWTDLECASGSRVGWLAQRLDARATRRLVGTESCEVTIPLAHPAAAELADGRVLRVTTADGAVTEWRITGLEERARTRTLAITAAPILLDLGAAGLIRDVTTAPTQFTFSLSRQTPAELVTGYVLTNLAADGLSWLSVGTIDPTEVLEVASWARWSRLELLRWLEQQTGAELSLRRDGASGYVIDLLTETGSTAPRVRLETGRNVLDLTRTRSSGERVTAVHVVGATVPGATEAATVAEVAFEVTGKSGAVLTLAEPVTGADMLAFDDQLNGYYLLARDGALVEITDTDATAQTVTLTSGTAFTVGDVVGLRADSSGALVTEVPCCYMPRLVRTISVPSMRGERNYVANPLFLDWTSVSEPTHWTEIGTAFRVGEYLRDSPTSFASAVADGSNPSGVPNVNVRGVPANARFYRGEIVATTAGNYVIAANVAVANGSGVVSLPLTTNVASTVADGSVIGLNTFGSARPTAFPDETYTAAVLRMMSPTATTDPPSPTADRLQSAAFGVRYLPGPFAQINVAAAFTMTRRTGQAAPTTGPCVMLRNHSTDARLAFARMTAYPDEGATAHETVAASATLTADTTVDVCLVTGSESYWHGCRWVMVWLGPSTSAPQTVGSMANAGWRRANAALLANSTVRAAYSVRLVDLSAFGATGDALTLGGTVHLVDAALGLDTTARVVGITYDLQDPANTQVTLDRPLPSLARQV